MQTLKCFRVLSLAAAIFLVCGEVALAQSGNLYNQLVDGSKSEVAKKGGKLTIALNWTNPRGKAIVEEFKKDFSFVKETKFERLRTVEEPSARLWNSKPGGRSRSMYLPSRTSCGNRSKRFERLRQLERFEPNS